MLRVFMMCSRGRMRAWGARTEEKALTLDFPISWVHAVVVKSNPGGRFQGISKTSDVGEIYARLGGRFNDSLAAHD